MKYVKYIHSDAGGIYHVYSNTESLLQVGKLARFIFILRFSARSRPVGDVFLASQSILVSYYPLGWAPHNVRVINWQVEGYLALFQYPKRRLFVRSREVSKPRDWYFQLSYRFEIWQAHRQQCCRSACQISERSNNSKVKSRGFEALRDLTKRRLFGYWNGALAENHITPTWSIFAPHMMHLGHVSTFPDKHCVDNKMHCLHAAT